MGVIIGTVDSGIKRNHVSFRDDGVPPPPSHWKGVSGCNNKIIGIRDYTPTRGVNNGEDLEGHGTHVASLASGNFVHDAHVMAMNNSFNGVHLAKQAGGIAAGTAPLSHLAIYKVEVDAHNKNSPRQIAKAIDDAVNDGVQIINLSNGFMPDKQMDFYNDPIAISSYRACQNGVLVVTAAGNEGPGDSTCSNGYPWVLTVGAGTIDRKIRTSIHFGDGQFIYGESISTFVGPSYMPVCYVTKGITFMEKLSCVNNTKL
uniref:subtilisin-like protease 4 n=1 Tax=Erigeron canadensis TaxID=72917 RepID=UPI001CB8B2E6|nr:subtilisin-like protease 4 [Erigeron canadensis]